jgi:hypothetical protein
LDPLALILIESSGLPGTRPGVRSNGETTELDVRPTSIRAATGGHQDGKLYNVEVASLSPCGDG